MRRSTRLASRRYNHRQEALWRSTAKWLGRILFSPFIILFVLVKGQGQADTGWVRGFLLFGLTLMAVLGTVILAGQASDRAVFTALARFAVPDEPVHTDEPYAAEVNSAASHYGVSPMAVFYVMEIESGGRPLLISAKGARGLMQLIPGTWRELNPASACKGDHPPHICRAGDDCIFSSWGSIRVGTLYLSRMLQANHGDYVAALQAYNAGQSRVVFASKAKFPETRRYVSSFIRLYQGLQQKQISMRLGAADRIRRLIDPLLGAFAAYIVLATLYFWRRHRRTY